MGNFVMKVVAIGLAIFMLGIAYVSYKIGMVR